MRTYRITEKEIEGMKPVAIGYKIFPNNFVAKGYDYKDENGDIVEVDVKTAWSFMPKEMEEYIRSLPEFDEKVFNQVTGRE